MVAGDVVRPRDPMPDEVGMSYVVVEMRGPRVLIRALDTGLSLPVDSVMLADQLERIA